MKKRCKFFKVFLFFVFFCILLSPKTGISGGTDQKDNSLQGGVSRFQGACRSNNFPEAVNALKLIETWKLDQGLKNTPSVSNALLKIYVDSLLFNENSNLQRLAVYEYIGKLSPDEPKFQWALFKRHLVAKPFDIYHLFKRVHKISNAIKTNLGWTLNREGQLILALIAALFLTVFCFALILIVKCSSYLVFYMRRFVRFPINRILAVLLIIIIFLLPIYFDIGFVWLPLFCMVLMWLVLSKWEKVGVLILILVLSASSAEIKSAGKFFTAASNKKSYLLYLANYSQLEPEAYRRLEKASVVFKQDAESLFTLGLLAKRRGDYKEAEKYYQAAIKAKPDFAECMNNLGNVYLLSKGLSLNHVESARSWYKKAIRINPGRAEFFYNLSKSYPLLQVEGVEYIIKARDLDPSLIDELTGRNSNHPNQVLVDCLLPTERIWHRAFSTSEASKSLGLLFWRFFLNTPKDNIFIMPAILLFMLVAFFVIQRRVELAVPCKQCGQLFFRTIPVHYSQNLCHQCQMIQKRSEQADLELVKRKEIEIVRYQRRKKLVTLIIGLLPAGGGFVLKGQALLGVLTAFLFYYFLSCFLIGHQVFPKLALWFYGSSSHSLLPLILAVLLYLVSLIPTVLTFVRGEV